MTTLQPAPLREAERERQAVIGRANLEARTGRDLSDRCDADFLDGVSHDIFALGDRPVNFSRYSEVRCRNLHRMVDAYIAGGEAKARRGVVTDEEAPLARRG